MWIKQLRWGRELRAAHLIVRRHNVATCSRPLLFAVILSVYASGIAQGVGSEPAVEPCPAAAEWLRSHPPLPEAQHAAASRAELLDELKVRVANDQNARRQWLADSRNENLARAVDTIDISNLAWLRKLIGKEGFPTAAQVGNEGVHLAWVLLQHADQDVKFQSALLFVLEKRYSAGELSANDLSRFTDRVLVANSKPQRFGTQFDWMASESKLPEGSRLVEIDADRRQLGLVPLADYACAVRSARERNR